MLYNKAFPVKFKSRKLFKSLNVALKGSRQVRIILVYRLPPSTANGLTVENFFSEFRSFIEQIIIDPCPLIITSDFNFHLYDRNNPQGIEISRHDQFFKEEMK